MNFGGKIGLLTDYILAAAGWKPPLEKSLRTLDTLVQLNALGFANTPPTSGHGHTYIVGTAPVGAFSGQAAGAVATYHSTLNGWEFYTPLKGWQGWIGSDMYYYSGSQWLLIGALPSVTNSGATAGGNAANTAIAAHETAFHNLAQAYHGTAPGVGLSLLPAGTWANLAIIQQRDSPTLTLANTTQRAQLVMFSMSSEVIYYSAVNSVLFSYFLLVNGGVHTSFGGNSRVPPHNLASMDNRNFSGAANLIIPPNTIYTFNLREDVTEANGTSVTVPASTVLSYGGSLTYAVFNI